MRSYILSGLVLLVACSGSDAPVEPGPQLPAKPFNLVTASVTGGMGLTWTDATNETHYKLEFRPAAQQAWLLLPNLPANSTSFTHSGIEKGINYFYRIAACNEQGCSEWTETSGQWTAPNGPPTLLTTGVNQIGGYAATAFATAVSGGVPVTFVFSFSKAGETVPFYTETMVEAPPVNSSGDHVVSAFKRYNLLKPGTDYVVNVVINNQYGPGGTGEPKPFSTPLPTPPTMDRLNSALLQNGQGVFNAWIQPRGFDTDYVFEIVKAGDSFATPLSSEHGHTLGTNLDWLGRALGLASRTEAGGTYHWRVVATNEGGTTISPTQVFQVP